jgi:hypothetical protein
MHNDFIFNAKGNAMLTEDQKELLRMASSKMTPEDYSSLEKEEQLFYAQRVEAAIATIHTVSPQAFLFKYHKGEKQDIQTLMLDRNFYHTPTGTNAFNSAKKHKILFPDHLKIKVGV